MAAIQVFISYAHEDIEVRKRLSKELQLLEFKGLVKPWHDGEISAGARWDDSIRSALGRSDLVILLLSSYFTASNYIFKEELPLILERYAQGKTKVIPVLARPTATFDLIGIDHLQCLPQDENKRLKAITSWANEDEAWAVVMKVIIKTVEELVNAKPVETPSPDQPKFKLGEYHKYACDRIDQRDLFYERIHQQNRKCHYFYLYGEILQSHSGMFQRIVYDKQDLLQDRLNEDVQPSCQIVARDITFDFSKKEHIYKQNILKNLLTAFHISLSEEEPILESTAQILLNKSPEVKALGAKDAVCILLSISEWDWDKDRTPKIVRWLLSHFFEVALPPNAPNFYLFFGLTYETQDGRIEQEIVESIEAGEHGIVILPELEPVPKRDIARWFARYASIFETRSQQMTEREKYFAGKDAVDMEDVEIKLAKIIDAYNRR
ncbi:MAG: TIR domain-containing protein [Bacteroidota bacterium]